ncbi:MAG: hypothetical protein WD151_15040 [Phycisphaeraceae bacterium]
MRILAIAIIVSLVSVTIISAQGEAPPAEWQDEVARSIVRAASQQGGSPAAAAMQVAEQAEEARSQRIAELIRIIETPRFHEGGNGAHAAMQVLGEMRAEEAVEVLVRFIAFPYERHPEAQELYFDYLSLAEPETLATGLPPVRALVKIGLPSVGPVVRRYANTEASFERIACETVLRLLNEKYPIRSTVRAAVEREVEAQDQDAVWDALEESIFDE